MNPQANLLVSSSWRAPGRARREILGRLRALGDDAAVVSRTERKGILAVLTALDPREAIRRLRGVHEAAPGAFRYTYKWVPVDVWTASDIAALRAAVTQLRDRIAPGERWRVTVERRTGRCPPAPEVIAAVVDLVDRTVDLTHPSKILLIELFERDAALAVVSPIETLTTTAAAAPRPWPHAPPTGTGRQ
jgi:tRNA(Ser,Leu) C12 N-acetylase TAN1